mgnify:CR=1 FL=1
MSEISTFVNTEVINYITAESTLKSIYVKNADVIEGKNVITFNDESQIILSQDCVIYDLFETNADKEFNDINERHILYLNPNGLIS